MLNAAQMKARDGKLTASRVACLMTGDNDKILNLWRELVGDPTYVEEDLSNVWAVQLGSCTEALNLEWYERRTGRDLSRHGEVVTRPGFDWAACTLDAFDEQMRAPVEAKHVGGFEKHEAVIARYMPQMHWQMLCTGTNLCMLSVIEGAREPVIDQVQFDGAYASELWDRAFRFMQCVWQIIPPVEMAPVAAPVKAEKSYDMTGKNEWAAEAVTWVTTRQAAKDNAAADKAIKAMVPADAAKCTGHGIAVSRNRAGSLSIRELRE
jgi:predicted phage-related endonuclease